MCPRIFQLACIKDGRLIFLEIVLATDSVSGLHALRNSERIFDEKLTQVHISFQCLNMQTTGKNLDGPFFHKFSISAIGYRPLRGGKQG